MILFYFYVEPSNDSLFVERLPFMQESLSSDPASDFSNVYADQNLNFIWFNNKEKFRVEACASEKL